MKLKSIIEAYVRREVRRQLTEATFNIDRAKQMIDPEVFKVIGKADQSKLKKMLKDVNVEMELETHGSTRYSKLWHEMQFIKYRLEEL